MQCNFAINPLPTTPVVPSPTSSSWDLESSTISLAIWCSTSIILRMVAPSFVMVTSPSGLTNILSIPVWGGRRRKGGGGRGEEEGGRRKGGGGRRRKRKRRGGGAGGEEEGEKSRNERLVTSKNAWQWWIPFGPREVLSVVATVLAARMWDCGLGEGAWVTGQIQREEKGVWS